MLRRPCLMSGLTIWGPHFGLACLPLGVTIYLLYPFTRRNILRTLGALPASRLFAPWRDLHTGTREYLCRQGNSTGTWKSYLA
ncbi:hypothetical protein BJV74DRAFT_854026, partial [Russula compacta]